jgi:hypothetical protein
MVNQALKYSEGPYWKAYFPRPGLVSEDDIRSLDKLEMTCVVSNAEMTLELVQCVDDLPNANDGTSVRTLCRRSTGTKCLQLHIQYMQAESHYTIIVNGEYNETNHFTHFICLLLLKYRCMFDDLRIISTIFYPHAKRGSDLLAETH